MPTALHRLHAWASSAPADVAQRYKQNGSWQSITASEFRDRVYYLALFLESRGVSASDCVVILSQNCPEWVQLNLGALLAGAKSAGVYPNSTPRDVHYVLNHAPATVLALQHRGFAERITAEHGELELPARVRLIVAFDGDTGIDPRAVAFHDALAEGKQLAQSARAATIQTYLDRLDPMAGAMMIYTSGTTGNPKGALLSHDNLVFASDVTSRFWKIPDRGTLFSFLPLCHIAEQLQNIGIGISRRCTVSFASSFENAAKELVEVQPTLLLCVPRLWEKMMEGVMSQVGKSAGVKRRLADWALGIGARVAEARYAGRRVKAVDAAQLVLAQRLVLSKIRGALGLARAELVASGAAALPAHVSRWFRSLDVEILEDYGQTETTGILCMTEPGVDSAGTVGKPIPGLEFQIAPDGEILTRGRNVFVGYYRDDVATTAARSADGWLHTGDLGEVDARGLVRILGRKKEIMKTSGGKMVAPLPIEEQLKASPLIGHVCMVGDGRKFFSALITLSEQKRSELRVMHPASLQDVVVRHEETVAEIGRAVDALNQTLAQYAQIKRFVVVSSEFSVAEGEITPTLKVKRSVVEARFRDVIDSMYTDGNTTP